VAIEAGHGGPHYWGGSGRDSDGNLWIEKDLALEVSSRLQGMLTERGYGTIMVRPDDFTLTDFAPADYRGSLIAEAQARVDRANSAQADALVSVHFNGWVDSSQAGTETYCNPDRSFGGESCALALFVQDALVRHIWAAGYEVKDRGLKNDADVHGDPANQHSFLLGTNANFRPSLMPGVIAEVLFLSNPDDLNFIRRADSVEVIAGALAEGIDAYFRWLNPPAQ
jgi:N-acetylmuramoyl-L-alanine amidase